ncbi:MAG: SirB2 family protein [Rhodocyclaceae bacterium]|nr:SirB2 family protein [Rhodocyclaceae bacterium]MBK9309228.1 SirB2 family protein [Rhodocyclaceae bacterium]MBK9955677.1 SirB2 family protein [Rhodocyclaceae bacterium]
MYLAVKSLHVACVIVSITGFFMRGWLTFADSPAMGRRWLKWAPHVNDTVLLAAAISLAVMSEQYPLAQSWLTAKIVGLLAYILLGMLALKPGRSRGARIAAWLAALVVFAYVVAVALTRDPAGFLAWFGWC